MSDPDPRVVGPPPGWYDVPGRRGKRCYWDGAQWAPWIGSPAWYDVPGELGVRRFWNGQHWTERYRRRGTSKAMILMTGLAAIGTAILFWGATLAFRTPELPQTSASAPGCSNEALFDFIAPLWLPWSLLVLLVIVGAAVKVRGGPTDPRMTVILGLGVLAVACTFPMWMFLLSGASCAR